jgi:hypothetical protein
LIEAVDGRARFDTAKTLAWRRRFLADIAQARVDTELTLRATRITDSRRTEETRIIPTQDGIDLTVWWADLFAT